MMGILDILLPAFFMLCVLVPMHTYLGVEIIRRQIIFTDLAVGQMAAVGMAISTTFFHGNFSYALSVAFAVLTGVIIAFAGRKSKYAEAFIGAFYAFGFSLLFLIMSKSPSGMENIKKLTASDVLYVDFKDVIISAVLYLTFFTILHRAKSSKYYDFVYFPIFALTIVHSVSLVGVLVVFSILVIPALIGFILNEKNVFKVGVISGITLSFISIIIAVKLDIPVGYTITGILSFAGISTVLLKG